MTNNPDSDPPFGTNDATADSGYLRALDYLYGRINYERVEHVSRRHSFGLRRMDALLEAMGNPHQALRIVHIAGTKGKGSTSSMVAAMATASGLRCGMYTSPHLRAIEERFKVDGQLIERQELVDLIAAARSASEEVDRAGDGPATFFEMTTAIALEHFRRRACDLVVLEVGLGGRLDSTNICAPIVTAITSIGLDHQRLLGSTTGQIAAEKAGIIKPGVPVVSGVTDEAANQVIRSVARRQGAPILQRAHDFDFTYNWHSGQGTSFDFTSSHSSSIPLVDRCGWQLGVDGEHQASNAAVSLAIIDSINHSSGRAEFDNASCRDALSGLALPARIELFGGNPDVILDTAHNRDSMRALCRVLRECYAQRNIVALFGTSRDKDAREMLEILVPSVSQTVLTRYRTNPRWYPPQELATIAAQYAGHSWEVVEDAHDALQVARRHAGPDGLIVICGSFFLAAELSPLVKPAV